MAAAYRIYASSAANGAGRKLPFRVAEGLRPTGDRVRETLFNWLQWDIRGADCLDLFAGSGALGFEAASRGAAHVSMVEKDRNTCAQLRDNIRMLATDVVDVSNQDAFAYLAETDKSFDIVFIDPPFALALAGDVCAAVESSGVLCREARIYVETPTKQTYTFPPQWEVLKSSRAGQVVSVLYRRRCTNLKYSLDRTQLRWRVVKSDKRNKK